MVAIARAAELRQQAAQLYAAADRLYDQGRSGLAKINEARRLEAAAEKMENAR